MAWALHSDNHVVERRARGFTLIEMMIVVVIIGVLATLAVVGYRKLVLSSHVSEATNMVQNIRVAQEAYHSEVQSYANMSAAIGDQGVGSTFYPQAVPIETTLTGWGGPCGGQCSAGMDWSMLPVHVDGPVMFGYATVAGGAGSAPVPALITVNGNALTFPSPSPTDWFIVQASCDLDVGGAPNTNVYTVSWTNQVFVDNEGQ